MMGFELTYEQIQEQMASFFGLSVVSGLVAAVLALGLAVFLIRTLYATLDRS